MLERQVIVLAVNLIYLIVTPVGYIRVFQAEVYREIPEYDFIIPGHVVGVGRTVADSLIIIVGNLGADIYAHSAIRLQLFDKPVYVRYVPVLGLLVPAAVEPYLAHVAVVGEQLGKLGVHKLAVFTEIFGLIRRLVAVPQRIIHAEFQTVFPACVTYSLHDIGLVARRCHVVIGDGAVPQAEAVMMLCHEQHIAESRVARRAHPLLAIKFGRIVSSGRLFSLRPFHLYERIHPEMNKHSVATFPHLLLAGIFFCRRGDAFAVERYCRQ